MQDAECRPAQRNRKPSSTHRARIAFAIFSCCFLLFLANASAIAQTGQQQSITEKKSAAESFQPELPDRVQIPAKQRIAVDLDTLVSTRGSKIGEPVAFHTTYSILLGDDLEVPPNMEVIGHVMQLQRPGHFGKQGVLAISIDRLSLKLGSSVDIKAHLDSKDLNAQARPLDDKNHPNNFYNVSIDTAGGTSLGAMIGSAKGAGIGAGAGAAIALLIMAERRGDDVYLEPGMSFSVILDQPAYLSGEEIYAAQQAYLKNRRAPVPDESDSSGANMPKLKRRLPPPGN